MSPRKKEIQSQAETLQGHVDTLKLEILALRSQLKKISRENSQLRSGGTDITFDAALRTVKDGIDDALTSGLLSDADRWSLTIVRKGVRALAR